MPAPRWSVLSLGLGLAALAVAAVPARAQAQSPDFEAARRHYAAGEQASTAGDHKTAAREYVTAYEITRDAVLFFKIGQAYDRSGDCRKALTYYRRYLDEGKPSPEYKERTDAQIAGCRKRTGAKPDGGAKPDAGAKPGAAPEVGAVSGASRRAAPGAAAGTPTVTQGPAGAPGTAGAAGAAGAVGTAGAEGTAGAPGTTGAAGTTGAPGTASAPGTAATPGPSPTGAPGSAPGTGSTTTGTPGSATETAPRREPTPPVPAIDGEPIGAPKTLAEAPVSWQRTAAWTSVGFTFALGTTAAVLGLSARSREEDIQNLIDFRDTEGLPARYTGPTRDRYRDLVREGDRLETLSIVALAATGGAAAASVVFFLLDGARSDDEDRAARLVPSLAPGAAGLQWTGSF